MRKRRAKAHKKGKFGSSRKGLRWRLWQEQRYKCPLCLRVIEQVHLFDNERVNIDHIVPKSCGGTALWGNAAVTHKACNAARGNRCAGYYPGYGPKYHHPKAMHDWTLPWSCEDLG